MAFLDHTGLEYFLNKIKLITIPASAKGSNNGVAELNANGTVPLAQLPQMSGASELSDGTSGLVPAPTSADEGSFLRGDATWQVISLTDKVDTDQGVANAGKLLAVDTYGMVSPIDYVKADFTGATSLANGEHGFVPAPQAGDDEKYLRGDGTWDVALAPTSGARTLTISGTIVASTAGVYNETFAAAGVTSSMKAIDLELGTPSVFMDAISVTCNNGSITISCNNVYGTSTFKVTMIASYMQSTEYDTIMNKIGDLSDLPVASPTDLVSAISEVDARIANVITPLIGDDIDNNPGIAIPAVNQSVIYSIPSLTVHHVLLRWGFSASPENNPPTNLTCTIADGRFTITNNGPNTSAEYVKPVFCLPLFETATAVT